MTESSPAHESSSPPASPTLQPTDERNDEVAGDESAPLLPSDERNDEVAGEESAPLFPSDPSPAPAAALSRAISILTTSALSFSALTLSFLFATFVALSVGPERFYLGWQTNEGIRATIAPAIFSLLISAFNLRRIRTNKPIAPLLINIVFDVLIAFFAISYAAGGLSGVVYDEGSCYRYPQGDDEACIRHGLPARVFAGIAMGMGVILGLVHLVLFAIRCRLAFRSEFWKGPWGFPNGQLTIEVSVKMFREPQRPTQVGTEAV